MVGNKTKRQERFNSLLRNLVSSFIRKEIGSEVLVTVMRTETSEDLRLAKIFVSVFPENKEKEIIEMLKKKLPELYRHLGSQLKIKFLPSISFEIDRAIKLEREIEEILRG